MNSLMWVQIELYTTNILQLVVQNILVYFILKLLDAPHSNCTIWKEKSKQKHQIIDIGKGEMFTYWHRGW